MNTETIEKSELSAYDPDNLLDTLLDKLSLKNDAALSRALEVAPPVISKIRHRRLPVGPSMLIRMHEVSDLSIRELRTLMGDRRQITRFSNKTRLGNNHSEPTAADDKPVVPPTSGGVY